VLNFLLYLTPVGQEIVSVIRQSNFNIKQNSAVCRNKDLFGILIKRDLTICLDNIKNKISPVEFYVNETLNHEAVHLAQSCKGGRLGISTALDKYKLNDARRSSKVGGADSVREQEAYELEDKPEQVLAVLRKYCL